MVEKTEYDERIPNSSGEDQNEYDFLAEEATQFIKSNDLEAALDHAKQLIDMKPNGYLGWDIAGRVYRRKRELDLAILHHEKAIELEKNTDFVYNNLALAQGVSGEYVEAFGNYQRCLEINPRNDVALKNCSGILKYINSDRVLPFLEKLKVKRNDELANETLAEAYALKADGLVQIEDGSLSFANEEQIQEYIGLMKKANNLSKKPEYDQKISEAEDILSGIEYEPLYEKSFHFFEVRDLNEALNIGKRLIEINPNDWRSWQTAGLAYCELGNIELAYNYFEKAIKLEKNVDYLHYNMGFTQERFEMYGEAFSSYQNALNINFENDDALKNCNGLLPYMNIDSVLPFLESLKEKRQDELAYETLATAYSWKAEELVYKIDGSPCFTSKEQIEEYIRRIEKAKAYSDRPELDQKIAEANRALKRTIDKQKIPVLILPVLYLLSFVYEVHTLFTPLSVVIFLAVVYGSFRPRYEINRLKVGTGTIYDDLVAKSYIKGSTGWMIFTWFMITSVISPPFIGLSVYSVLSIYIIFSSMYSQALDQKDTDKLLNGENDGLPFESESERRRRLRKIAWSPWLEKWGPIIWKVAKVIGILMLVVIVGYILFWIAVIGIALMVMGSGSGGSSSGSQSDPVEEARRQNQMIQDREQRLWEDEQMRKNSRRR